MVPYLPQACSLHTADDKVRTRVEYDMLMLDYSTFLLPTAYTKFLSCLQAPDLVYIPRIRPVQVVTDTLGRMWSSLVSV